MSPHADRNLLFGILALQMDFVTRDALIAAMHAWVLDKSTPLGEILVAQGALPRAAHHPLEALVEMHLELHGGDPLKSLSAVSSVASVRLDLEQLGDPEVSSLLASTPPTPAARFHILRPHRKGGLGEVFVARDEELNREVALKEIQLEFAYHPEYRARFLREAEVTGNLEHPGIVPVYSLGRHGDQRPYYAMRFIKGDSLKDAIRDFHEAEKRGRSNSEQSLELRQLLGRFIDVCQAIAYAHSRGVLHRDIKPSNIMLGKYGETLVVDWGLTKSIGKAEGNADGSAVIVGENAALTQAGRVMGTPAYASPEQAAGKIDDLRPQSDVYSLGATLYTLLVGRPAFVGTDAIAVLAQVQKGEFPAPRQVNPRVPAALEAVCLKAMALQAHNRYATATELAAEVERWLADEPVQAYREPLRGRMGRWLRKHQALTAGVGALLLTGVVALAVTRQLVQGQARKERARAQVAQLTDVNADAVQALLDHVETSRAEVREELHRRRGEEGDRRKAMRLALGLLHAGGWGDEISEKEKLRDELVEWMLTVKDPAEVLLVRQALLPHRAELTDRLWGKSGDGPAETRFRALVALAAFAADSPRWKEAVDFVAERLVQTNPLHLGTWVEALRPVREHLHLPLREIYLCDKREEARGVATTVLLEYFSDSPELLVELLVGADDRQFREVLARLGPHGERGLGLLRQEVAGTDTRRSRERAAAALALLRLGKQEETWGLWRHVATPEVRSWMVVRAAAVGVEARQLITRLGREEDVSARRALILALGEYTENDLPQAVRGPLVEKLLAWYRDDPDAGIHGAIDWLLRHDKDGPVARRLDWQQRRAMEKIDIELAASTRLRAALIAGRVGPGRDHAPGWVVNGQGMTFTVVPGPVEFAMGAPETEAWYRGERRHQRRIPHSFAIGTKPVTVAQWERFQKQPNNSGAPPANRTLSPHLDCPCNGPDWAHAAAFCNWLSQVEGIPKDQWCYLREQGMRPAPGYLKRTGYRLPTEAEWEYACRAGATTARYFGASTELLPYYAFYRNNSEDRYWPVGQKRPNDFGLFDVHGNVWTWCQDVFTPTYPVKRLIEEAGDESAVPDGQLRVQRGGSYYDRAPTLRSAVRQGRNAREASSAYGLRVCRTCYVVP